VRSTRLITLLGVNIMVVTESTIYWITRLDGIRMFLSIMTGASFLAVFMACMWLILEEDKRATKFIIVSVITGLLLTLSSVFIPNTKEMCAIKVIPIIVNNEEVQELPNKVVELANDWINELKPSPKESK
jgi:hypothetical protein